jgi:hypothetical protein
VIRLKRLECRRVRSLAVLLLALLPVIGGAAPFAVQVGDSRVALDAPPGFSDVQANGSPRLLELAEALTSAANRILLFALEDGDVRRFSVGDAPELRRYVIAVTPKGLEHERVTAAAFRTFVADSLRELGDVVPAGNLRAHLDAQPRGQASLLAQLRNDAEAVSVLQGARLPEVRKDSPPRYILSTTTLLLVRGKALNVQVFSRYENDDDVQWIRTASSRWIDELQRLNHR